MKTTDITRGMTVYSHDGQELGVVEEVWANVQSHGHLPVSRYLLRDYGPVRGNAELFDGCDGYVQIRQGSLLGLGGNDRFLALSAITSIRSRDSLAITRHAEVHATPLAA